MKSFCFVFCIALVLNIDEAFGASKGMPQLNTEFWASQIFWLIIIFSILYFLIWKVFFPKITYGLENRKSRIVNDINESEKLKTNAEKKLQEYYKIIEESKKEAKKIIENDKKKLNKDIEIKKQKFEKEIELEFLNAEKEIIKFKKNSISNINKIAVEIASDVLEKIVGTESNKSNVTAIVENISKKKVEKLL